MFISKKTMRKKDFACLKAEKPNYKAFRAPKENARHKFQTLFKTPRGWFLSMMQDKKRVIGEISVPAAQEWLDECHNTKLAGKPPPFFVVNEFIARTFGAILP